MANLEIEKDAPPPLTTVPPSRLDFGFIAFCSALLLAFLVVTALWFFALWWIASAVWNWL